MENNWIPRSKLEKEMKKGLEYALSTVKCKHCGHGMLLAGRDKRICSWCKHWVFKDDKIEFEYRLKEKIK